MVLFQSTVVLQTLASLAITSSAHAAEQSVPVTVVPSGMTAIMGGYMPSPIKLSSTKPASVTKVPAGLTAPSYGVISLAGKKFSVIVDEPAKGDSKFYVDSNGDGDFTNDAKPKWEHPKNAGANKIMMGSATVIVKVGGKPQSLSLGAYKFGKDDPNRASLKDTLLVYSDYGLQGTAKFGSASHKFYLLDPGLTGFKATDGAALSGLLMVDRQDNGKMNGRAFQFPLGKPFNIGDGSEKVSAIDLTAGKVTIAPSTEEVAMVPLPADLSVGQQSLTFNAVETDGTKVSFPNDYKGKIVLLDFWATWCGPCMGEVPNSVKVYNEFKDKGYAVLGVSLDQANSLDKVKSVTADKGMTWPQIYEGKYWDVSLVKQFGVEGIPFVLLVDGDTGKILATEESLRGEALEPTIKKALEAKNAAALKQ